MDDCLVSDSMSQSGKGDPPVRTFGSVRGWLVFVHFVCMRFVVPETTLAAISTLCHSCTAICLRFRRWLHRREKHRQQTPRTTLQLKDHLTAGVLTITMDFNGRMSTARSAQAGSSQIRRQEPHEIDAFMIVSA